MMDTGCQAIILHKVSKNISYLESFSRTYDPNLLFSHIMLQKIPRAKAQGTMNIPL